MTNYSIKVNEALERYGAKTCGTLERRVERLKRFTGLKNKRYAEELKIEHARMMANQEREERVQNRIREIEQEGVHYGRRLVISTGKAKEGRRVTMAEPCQEADVPMAPSSPYNLRSRNGLNLLWTAIQNGFVNTNRG